MAVTVTHATVAVGTDAGNGEIAKAEWNENHTVTGLGTAAEADTGDFAPAAHVGAGGTAHANAVAAGAAGFMTGSDKTKLDGIEALADVTDATNVDAAGAVMNSDTTTASMSFVIDEDNMSSDSATKVPTQQSVKAYADLRLPLAGGTMSGALVMADQLLTRPLLKDFGLELVAHGNTGSTETFDVEGGNYHTATLDQASTFTFSNPTASGDFCGMYIQITNGGAFVITWPGAVDWDGGAAPTLQTSGVDVLGFLTTDGGTVWRGYRVWADA